MVNPCAPKHANLLLGWWENTMVFTEEAERFTENIILWAGYIDDVFLLWRGDSISFQLFINWHNINPISLRFQNPMSSH